MTDQNPLGETRLAEIISDAEIIRVHAYANFGSMTPREVVNDGVRKTAVGYHCGHTQVCILREHGLITKSRGMSFDVNLTKKGKRYARVLCHDALFRASPPSRALSQDERGACDRLTNLAQVLRAEAAEKEGQSRQDDLDDARAITTLLNILQPEGEANG